jgi:signal transduction histidine kinase
LASVANAEQLFDGPGEMRSLCRALDWSRTALGPVSTWPVSLRTTLAVLLSSRHPMFLFWGPDLMQFYNDAYRPSLAEGGRHPRALGMRGVEFWTEIWDIIGPQIDQVMSGGEATWHEDHLVPIERNGRIEEVYWTYSYGPAFNDDGSVGGVLVVCQETTPRVLMERRLAALNAELQRERERLMTLVNAAPVVMAVYTGPEFVITYVNPAWEKVVGKPDALNRRYIDVFPETAPNSFAEVLARVYETGEPWTEIERRSMIQKWPDRPIEETFWNLSCYRVDGTLGLGKGGVAGHEILVYAVEVSAQVRARREAEEARAIAEAANRAKSDFLAVMSHELRTPLNAIAGYTELVEMEIHGPVTSAQREALKRIQRSERHLLGLVNTVLNYARLEAGNVHYIIRDVVIAETLSACETLIATQAAASGLTLDVEHCPPDIVVRADDEKVQQILINLLTNAVKFTERGGAITVTCEPRDDSVLIRVSDTGRGIEPEDLPRIFEPFVQVDTTLTRTGEGVGLGLAISRDLARGMNGDLTVESTRGSGSTFELTLPRSEISR